MTLGASGTIQARLMQPFDPEADLTIWFGTSPTARKVKAIQEQPQVSLGYADVQNGAYVTLTGCASIETDQAQRQQYWRETFAAFWPAGPASADYVLIKVVPTRIELMHIAQGVAPVPFGLRPVVLIRIDGAWVIADNDPGPASA
jgi:general stress protein 26